MSCSNIPPPGQPPDGREIPKPRYGRNQERRPAGGLPVRGRSRRLGVSIAYFDGRPEQVGSVRAWCTGATGLDEETAAPVVLALSELVSNAIQHTASGDRCGRVRVSVETMPGEVVLLGVTDDGPKAGQQITRPHLTGHPEEPRVHGRGLHLVAALSEKWWWTGAWGGPLTMWALIDPHRALGSG